MNRLIIQLIGLILLIAGIYYLGQDIRFLSRYSPYFWKSVPATGSVLAIASGILSLVFFRQTTGNAGWILIGLGIILVFISGGILLKATTLWNLFVGLVALTVGYKFLTEGRIRF